MRTIIRRNLSHDIPAHRQYNPSRRRVEIVTEVTDDIQAPSSMYCPNSTLIRADSDLVIWYKVKYVRITPKLDESTLANISQLIENAKITDVGEIEHIINLDKE